MGETLNGGTPLEEGTLDIVFSWPSGLMSAPAVDGSLTGVDGVSQDFSGFFVFGTSEEPNTETHSGSCRDDYYTLLLVICNGMTVLSHKTLVLRVTAGDAAGRHYSLNDTNGSLAAASKKNIGARLTIAYAIRLSGTCDSMTTDGCMTVEMVLNPVEVPDGVSWYLNGAELADAVDSGSVKIGPGGVKASDGYHSVDVLVRRDDELCSNGLSFRVMPAAVEEGRKVDDYSVLQELWSGGVPEADIQFGERHAPYRVRMGFSQFPIDERDGWFCGVCQRPEARRCCVFTKALCSQFHWGGWTASRGPWRRSPADCRGRG